MARRLLTLFSGVAASMHRAAAAWSWGAVGCRYRIPERPAEL